MGGRTLVIQVTNPPPPGNVKVFITLAKDFCYFVNDIAVTLREDSTITFKTNVGKETIAPAIVDPEDQSVMKFKDSNGDFVTLPFNRPGLSYLQKPQNIPACNDLEYITMSFNFSATDEGGSGIANRFRLYLESLDTGTGTPYIELPYSVTTSEAGYAQWSKESLIPRSTYLRSAGEYCFSIKVIDNDGNVTPLGDNYPYRFYLNLTQSVPNY